MRTNLMFSRGMDVVLQYHAVPAITNDSLSKRTMSVVNAKFPIFGSAKWSMVPSFNTCRKDSHELGSLMTVFLGILDFSNGEGGSSIDGW